MVLSVNVFRIEGIVEGVGGYGVSVLNILVKFNMFKSVGFYFVE